MEINHEIITLLYYTTPDSTFIRNIKRNAKKRRVKGVKWIYTVAEASAHNSVSKIWIFEGEQKVLSERCNISFS